MTARLYAPPPADGSSTRGGSTSVRGRVRSPHLAKLRAASVPIAYGSCAPRAGTDRRTDNGTAYRGVARSKYVGWTDMASAEGLEAEPTGPTPPPPPVKLVGFVSISGATSSKSGVDMSTPVHPVATPMVA